MRGRLDGRPLHFIVKDIVEIAKDIAPVNWCRSKRRQFCVFVRSERGRLFIQSIRRHRNHTAGNYFAEVSTRQKGGQCGLGWIGRSDVSDKSANCVLAAQCRGS
jgi:hypothetical protein